MDMIADVDEQMIKKYDLKLDSTLHGKMSEHGIFSALKNDKTVEYGAGGCSYNTMRVFNWMLEKTSTSDKVGVLGSVGDDFYGNLYTELLNKENIISLFEKYDNINTGVCCVFCHNRDRGHITDLGASILISEEYVNRIWNELQEVKLIYTELFILKHRKDIVFKLAELGLDDNKIFGFNLPSFYFIETYKDEILKLLEYADIIFSNQAEAKFLANLINIEYEEDDIVMLCKQLITYTKKLNTNKNKIIVITCGPNPAFIIEYNYKLDKITFSGSYTPIFADENEIVDTNGAGDAFAGGFLSKYVNGNSLEECMAAGHWASNVIIKQRGFQIPENIYYDS